MLLPKPFSHWGLLHVVGARRPVAGTPLPWSRHAAFGPAVQPPRKASEPAAQRWPAVLLGGSRVDLMGMDEAVQVIMDRASSHEGQPLAVCSANLDHIRHFGTGGRWAGTLDGHAVRWLTLIDGAPLSAEARRITGVPWPRLAGSDLMGPLLAEAERRGCSVGFLGGSEEAQDLIRDRLACERPGLKVAGMWAPERSVIADGEASLRLAREIAVSAPDILVVGLGKPRQELWINEYGQLTGARVLLAFGAVVDFLAGRIRRAPSWVADHSLEWAWRLMLEPRRLGRRYVVDGPEAYVRLRRGSGGEVSLARGWAPPVFEALPAFPGRLPGRVPGAFVPHGQRADVAVVVVTYNNADDVGPLMEGLRRETADQSLKVVVADNSPDERTAEALAAYRDVLLVRTHGNLGYAGGINAAMRAAGDAGAYLILNPDLRVEPGAVAALRRRMRSSGAGVVVPVLLDDDGTVYPSLRREPGVLRALGDAAFGGHFRARPGWLGEMDFDAESYQYAHPVEWATGAALLIDGGVAGAVGEWDEQFFLYSEETDYCRRVRDLGASIWFEPSAVMWHERGGSGTSPQLAALMSVNRVRYAQKHLGRLRRGAFRVAALCAEVARINKPGHSQAALALLDRRRWALLPAAVKNPPPPASGTVVIPAHNEAAVIARTLEALGEVIGWGTVEVVVACNGCSDSTASIAATFPGVRVLDVPEASKTAALNAADAVATRWPRLYLDADIEVTGAAVAAVLNVLGEGTFLAARPPFRYDTTGASWAVRAYYRARNRIPANMEGLWGAGAYALSESGHRRVGSFPPVTADDYYVDSLFGPGEKTVLDTVPVVVRTPRSPAALLAVLRRTYRGNAEQDTAPGDSSTSRTLRQLLSSVRGPLTAFDAAVYTAFAVAGRRRGFRPSGVAVPWERDNSSR